MKIESHTIVAIILAIGVASAVIVLAVETVLHSGSISTQEASLLSTVLGATVGAVATYLGLSKSDSQTNGSGNGEGGNQTPPSPPPPPSNYPPEAG